MSESTEEKIKKLFDNYDENSNGVLEKEELIAGLKDLISSLGEALPPESVQEIAEEAMTNFDLTGKGTIDFKEFTSLINFFIQEKGLKV